MEEALASGQARSKLYGRLSGSFGGCVRKNDRTGRLLAAVVADQFDRIVLMEQDQFRYRREDLDRFRSQTRFTSIVRTRNGGLY